MAAPKTHIKELWKQLGEVIKLGPAVRMDRFIGCEQEEFECPVSALLPILQLAPELQGREKEAKVSQSATLQNDEFSAMSALVLLHICCCLCCDVCNSTLSGM